MNRPDGGAREEILARLRTALARPAPGDAPAQDEPSPAAAAHYRRTGDRSTAQRREVFTSRLREYGAQVTWCGSGSHHIQRAVRAALAERETTSVVAPARVAHAWLGDDSQAAAQGPTVLVDDAAVDAARLSAVDAVVTGCAVGIAETGVVVLDGGPWSGRRLVSLVPDVHVCVVGLDQLVDLPPEAVERLDPRAPQTWIAGPSATSDIELQRVEGVHGPRTLLVIVAG